MSWFNLKYWVYVLRLLRQALTFRHRAWALITKKNAVFSVFPFLLWKLKLELFRIDRRKQHSNSTFLPLQSTWKERHNDWIKDTRKTAENGCHTQALRKLIFAHIAAAAQCRLTTAVVELWMNEVKNELAAVAQSSHVNPLGRPPPPLETLAIHSYFLVLSAVHNTQQPPRTKIKKVHSGKKDSREKWNVMKIEIGSSKLEDAFGSVITFFFYVWAEYSNSVELCVWQHSDDSPEVMCDICYANINYMLFLSGSNACNIEFFPSLPHLSVLRLLEAGPRMIKQERKKYA